MLEVIRRMEKENAPKKAVGITVQLPEFGSLDEDHFRFHFEEATRETPWQGLCLEIVKVPFGVDAKLSCVTLRDKRRSLRKRRRS